MKRITPYSLVRGTLATVILAAVIAVTALLSLLILAVGILVLAIGCIACDTWSDFRDEVSETASAAWRDIKFWFRTYWDCWTERP